jgi:type IV pilus assembly protein PilA
MKPVMNQLKRGFTLIELMIVVAIIGLLAALAIPNFIKFQARSKQSEARSNLKAVFTAEKSYYGDKQIFVDLLDIVGFSPERGNRYGYTSGGLGTEDRKAANAATTPGLSANCPNLSGVGYIAADNYKYGNGGAIGTNADPGRAIGVAMLAPGTTNPSGSIAVAAPGVFAAAGPDTKCCIAGICDFEASATGNIDNDLAWDGWIIASQSGPLGASAACAGAITDKATSWNVFASGEPVNVCNDLKVY